METLVDSNQDPDITFAAEELKDGAQVFLNLDTKITVKEGGGRGEEGAPKSKINGYPPNRPAPELGKKPCTP